MSYLDHILKGHIHLQVMFAVSLEHTETHCITELSNTEINITFKYITTENDVA